MSHCRTPMVAPATLPMEVLCGIFRVHSTTIVQTLDLKLKRDHAPVLKALTHRVCVYTQNVPDIYTLNCSDVSKPCFTALSESLPEALHVIVKSSFHTWWHAGIIGLKGSDPQDITGLGLFQVNYLISSLHQMALSQYLHRITWHSVRHNQGHLWQLYNIQASPTTSEFMSNIISMSSHPFIP